MNITLSEALGWVKTLRERHQELVSLRNENSSAITRRFGISADKEVTKTPTYDVKKLDKLITQVAREIHKLEQAIKVTNATTTVAAYDKNEDVLGEVE